MGFEKDPVPMECTKRSRMTEGQKGLFFVFLNNSWHPESLLESEKETVRMMHCFVAGLVWLWATGKVLAMLQIGTTFAPRLQVVPGSLMW